MYFNYLSQYKNIITYVFAPDNHTLIPGSIDMKQVLISIPLLISFKLDYYFNSKQSIYVGNSLPGYFFKTII